MSEMADCFLVAVSFNIYTYKESLSWGVNSWPTMLSMRWSGKALALQLCHG